MRNSFPSGPFGVRPARAGVPAGLLLLLSLALPAPVRAQTEQQQFRFGTHALRRMLYEAKFKALDDWDDLDEEPDRTLLVLLGHLHWRNNRLLLERIRGGLKNFVASGGAVLLATDEEIPWKSPAGKELTEVEELTEVAGTVVSGYAVSATPPKPSEFYPAGWATQVPEEAVYRGHSVCVIATPLKEGGPSLFVVRTAGQTEFRGLVTNRPSALWPGRLPRYAHRIADLPVGCRYERNGRSGYLQEPDENGNHRPYPFAVSSEYGKGRLLLLADHSVFINEMMLPSDTGNVDFAYNALDWLKGDDKERNRVLFVYDGKIETTLDIPIREEPVSLLDHQARLVNTANEQLKKIEAKNPWKGANEGTTRTIGQTASQLLFGGRSPWFGFKRLLVLLGALGAVFYGLARLFRASFRSEPHVPLFATAASRHAPSASALNQRYRHAVQEDNLGDYAHILAQEWLGTVYRGEGPPRVVAGGGWWARRSLRNLVGRIWRLAQADVPERMSQGEFRSFLADLERLREALASGDFHLE